MEYEKMIFQNGIQTQKNVKPVWDSNPESPDGGHQGGRYYFKCPFL